MASGMFDPGRVAVPRSLYVHVPFCRSKCSYCDFFSVAGASRDDRTMEEMTRATVARVRGLSSRFGAQGFSTVYVGGGTPSILPRSSLVALLSALGDLAPSPAEWTIEANPESVDEDFLSVIEGQGVTRLSLGVQSLDPSLLRILARPAGAEASLAALKAASRRRLRISADLIAGLPRTGGLVDELRILLEAGVGHVSVYDLVLEEGTTLEARSKRGEVALLSEDEAADEREEAEALLALRGFARYEVSNYALAGQESLHNLAYWRMDSYLGAGPGAVGTLALLPAKGLGACPGVDGGAIRIEEGTSLESYLRGDPESGSTESRVKPREAAFEVLMMGFRTNCGLDRRAFRGRFGLDPASLLSGTLEKWRTRLALTDDRIVLDGRGLDLCNGFLTDCLVELEANFPLPGDGGDQMKKS